MSLRVVHRVLLLWIQCIFVFLGCSSLAAAEDDDTVHVFYPEVREPYNLIFNEIVEGIRDGTDSAVITHSISSSAILDEFRVMIGKSRPGSIIMLGSIANMFRTGSDEPITILSGASVLTNADIAAGQTGISISPEPARLFSQLKELKPEIQEIAVVYHQETNGWLIDLAKSQAEELGLVLDSIEASDVREAAMHYRSILEGPGNTTRSLWLLQGDPTLDEKGLLPDVLAQAWNGNYVVFSSNPSYVNRGALFSLVPDNYEMGKSLASMAEQRLNGEEVRPLPVSDLKKALNTRTAEHLNIRISRSQQRSYDFVFPSR